MATLCLTAQAEAQSMGEIAFLPPHPTTEDAVTVVFAPATGQPNRCPIKVTVQRPLVFIESDYAFSGECGNQGALNTANLGKVAAGVYQVIWAFKDPLPSEIPVIASLTVVAAPVQAPALSLWGALLLALCVTTTALAPHRRPRYEP